MLVIVVDCCVFRKIRLSNPDRCCGSNEGAVSWEIRVQVRVVPGGQSSVLSTHGRHGSAKDTAKQSRPSQ